MVELEFKKGSLAQSNYGDKLKCKILTLSGLTSDIVSITVDLDSKDNEHSILLEEIYSISFVNQ